MTQIVQKDEPVLRKHSKPVSVSEISSAKIKNIISKMKTALDSQPDGVAIAAPQVGENLSIFIVSKRVFEMIGEKEIILGDADNSEEKYSDLIFINPKLVRLSKTKEWVEEGCLSVRWLYGEVKRSVKATVRAYNEQGKKFERGGSGILAQIFQHETDHLNGILFTDKARNVREVKPESQKQ